MKRSDALLYKRWVRKRVAFLEDTIHVSSYMRQYTIAISISATMVSMKISITSAVRWQAAC